MQTVTLKIEDGFMNQFMNYISTLPKNKVQVVTDKLYFEIKNRIENIESGKEKSLPFHDGLDNIKSRTVHEVKAKLSSISDKEKAEKELKNNPNLTANQIDKLKADIAKSNDKIQKRFMG